MKISYHTVKDNLDTSRGYGAAGYRVVTSLQELGHEVPFDDPSAPVQISFCPPHHYKFNEGQYRIGYTPWESTELPDGWTRFMNDCDEVWATSEFVANVFEMNGVTKPIYVYHHGLDKRWTPVKRTVGDVVKFLHHGEPALRKGGQMTLDAFRAVFGDRTDVHLTIKAYHQHFLRVWDNGILKNPDDVYKNVTIIRDQLHHSELVELYQSHDIMVYPSYGEGFGLIPLQALGTGLPVISTSEWAPYKKYIGMLSVSGQWNRSIWSLHPGDVFYPDYNQLKNIMRNIGDNPIGLQMVQDAYYDMATDVRDEYDWLSKTEEAFSHIVSMFIKS